MIGASAGAPADAGYCANARSDGFVPPATAAQDESEGPRMELVGLDAATGKRLWPRLY
ncbi:hypothetical protein QNO09_05260 [Streptomyces sp. 378]|uniref:hypothetical protein n=1 Tax=Streptomyces sp. 378 TaxID=3049412 RepID=UPI0024C31613|nr:hypothetical protein [Streptomyces sp. 378]MDK1342727.1 hypothetical protein [Streptomyces sp. 378]